MAQHDYVISNGTGAAVRSDLNNGLAAIVSNNSGSTEPATMYAYQWWADTTTGLLKQRNAANSAWITIGTLATTNLGLAPVASPTFTGTVTMPAVAGNVAFDTNTLFVDAANNRVGLGTSSPSANLHVAATVSDPILFSNTSAGAYNAAIWKNNSNYQLAVGIGGSSVGGGMSDVAFVGSVSNIPLSIQTNNTARISITAGGNVGIGSTVPGSKLCVGNGASIDDGLSISFTGDNSTLARFFANTSTGAVTIGGIAASYYPAFFSGGAERARIDTSGRLLVGTSSSSGPAIFTAQGYAGSSTGEGIIALQKGAATPANGDSLGVINFANNGANNAAQVYAQRDGGTWTSGTSHPGRLVFSTTANGASSPTERMRIDSSGLISAGSSNVNGAKALSLTSGQINTSGGLLALRTANDLNGGYFVTFNNGASAVIGTITQASTSSVAYNTTSDYRLKENVVPLANAIDRLQRIPVHCFNFITEPETTVDGFIAHEVQQVVPECVTGEKDAVDDDGNPVYQGIDQSKLVPLLTAALQEAIAKIETLEQRLADAGIA